MSDLYGDRWPYPDDAPTEELPELDAELLDRLRAARRSQATPRPGGPSWEAAIQARVREATSAPPVYPQVVYTVPHPYIQDVRKEAERASDTFGGSNAWHGFLYVMSCGLLYRRKRV